jgi:ankyrin repeat protein
MGLLFSSFSYGQISDYPGYDFQELLNEKLLREIESDDTVRIKSLIEQGADVNATTFEGVTPLMFATIYGFQNVAKVLIDAGAKVDKSPYDGRTPLIEAVVNQDIEIGEMLVLNGADLEKKDREGYTALHYATMNGLYYAADMLLFYGADTETGAGDGSTALILAAFIGFPDICELLLNAGAMVNAKDDKGFTPLMSASQQGQLEIVKMLLEYGAPTETTNKYGQTALSYGIKNGHMEVIETLVASGANYNHTFNKGYNLIYLAEKNNQYEARNYLKSLGSQVKTGFYFDKFNMNTGFSFTSRDALYQLSMGITESRQKINLDLIYQIRLGKSFVIEEENNTLLQLRENRSYFGINIEKEFVLYDVTNLTKYGASVSGRGMFSYGDYEGLKRNPKGMFLLSPALGLYYRKGGGFVRIQYEFLNNRTEGFPKNRVACIVGFDVLYKRNIIKGKELEW